MKITLQRTACYGTCPAYTVTISGVADAILAMRIDSYEKRVAMIPYYGTPRDLQLLMERIDRETGVEQWIE